MTTKKTTKSNPKAPTSKVTTSVVLYGLDQNGEPRAARFFEANQSLLSRLAQALSLRIGIASGAKHADTLAEIPPGRVFSTGNGVVPNISQELYDKIIALTGGEAVSISSKLPKSWDDLAAGDLVIVQEGIAEGWFEAIVVSRTADEVTVRFRDYPSQPEITRPLTAIALLKAE